MGNHPSRLRAAVTAGLTVAAAATFVGAAQAPAAASPNVCTADDGYFWSTDQDMVDAVGGDCRSTYVIDVGAGKRVSRADLVEHEDLYRSFGFTQNFLWYAPRQGENIPAGSGQQWASCKRNSPRDGIACRAGSTELTSPHTISYDFGSRAVTLDSLVWEGNFIALACGNFNIPVPGGAVPAPVPVIRGFKFDDRNHDGVQDDGEGGIGGVTFQLFRDSSLFHDQPLGYVTSTQSRSDGTFAFPLDVAGPGDYTVREVSQPGWITTTVTSVPVTVEAGQGSKVYDLPAFGNREEHAPVADAGPDQAVDQTEAAGAQVTLDGSGSSDVDGDPLTYAWSWTDSSGQRETATGVRPTVTLPAGDGPTEITLVVNDGIEDSAPDTVAVTVYPPITVAGQDAAPTEGKAFSGPVGTFTDPDPNGRPAEYAATIDWGDGTPSSTGVISKGGDGTFTVTGDHTYAEEGGFTGSVTVTDVDNPFNSGHSAFTATVSDAALKATGEKLVSPNPVDGEVATFSDANPYGSVDDFTATIDWGDGTPVTPGRVSGPVGGPFSVAGTHTYATLGKKTITVTIVDDGGSRATAVTPVTVFAPSGFVIGDQNSAVGTAVTFWGAQWWKLNALSGGPAPAAFKGYENEPGASTSLTSWTTDPGNSSKPPASVPTYMSVIVASSISQHGSTISGDAPHVVIVRTDPAYAPDPGHAGTGTVVDVLR